MATGGGVRHNLNSPFGKRRNILVCGMFVTESSFANLEAQSQTTFCDPRKFPYTYTNNVAGATPNSDFSVNVLDILPWCI